MEGNEKHIIENLKIEFTECGDASLESANVAYAAKLLIIFFQELPEPLIPVSAQTDLIKDMESKFPFLSLFNFASFCVLWFLNPY